MTTVETMPALYLSHGAPPLADDEVWTGQLAHWSASLAKPTAILVISAHWEEAPLAIGATTAVPLVYDFGGFAPHYYQVQYNAPGAPGLAAQVKGLLSGAGYQAQDEPLRGLDHGAYVPLVEMYPEADVPVLQISMPTLDPVELMNIGRALAPLREQGVLLLGSGFTTHNLRLADFRATDAPAPLWSAEFDQWTQEMVESRDYDALLDFARKAPAASLAHPRTEHFAPLFVALGASMHSEQAGKTTVDGFWFGMSKRSFQFD